MFLSARTKLNILLRYRYEQCISLNDSYCKKRSCEILNTTYQSRQPFTKGTRLSVDAG